MSYNYMGGLGYRGYTHSQYPSGVFTKIPSSEDVKRMKKAFRSKKQVELRWHEIWVSNTRPIEVLDLFFEYSFPTQSKASKFLGDLLMGVRNHSDLVDVDDEGNWIEGNAKFGYVCGEFETLKEECTEENLDPKDFELKEVNNLIFVVDMNK